MLGNAGTQLLGVLPFTVSSNRSASSENVWHLDALVTCGNKIVLSRAVNDVCMWVGAYLLSFAGILFGNQMDFISDMNDHGRYWMKGMRW
ncbi:hypothetical protein PGB90_007360 [Kerria lacca]